MSHSHNTSQREESLYERLAEFMDSGQDLDQGEYEALAAEFPDFATEVREFAEGRSELCVMLSAPWAGSHDALTDTVRIAQDVPSLPEYEMIRQIARGGMGIVYEARHRELNRTVALKMIRSGDIADDDDVRRFRSEAQQVAQLDHPHVVPLYEVGSHESQHYFTMRLMPGGTLADRIEDKPLSAKQAATIISQVARGVHYAHQRGILHRDVKPANILFADDGSPQIGDFGLAKRIERGASLHSGAIVGTPMYMAPEQAVGSGKLTTSADVYGLGAVLYELLTGRPPFRDDNPLNTLVRLAKEEPARPRTLRPDVDAELETICLKCLERDPNHRYGSADALADDLDRWLRNEPIFARPSSPWLRIVKWSRRSPAVAALSGVVLLTVAAFVAALFSKNIAVTYEQQRTAQAYANLQQVTYFQNVALAERAIFAGDMEQAARFLEDCPPELRQWEWRYLQRLCHADLRSRPAPAETSFIAIDGVGRVFVGGGVAGLPGEVWSYDPEIKRRTSISLPHDDSVTALAVAASGELLVSGDRSGGLYVTKLTKSAESVRLMGTADAVYGVAISPIDGSIASCGEDGVVRIWTREGKLIHEVAGHESAVWSVAFHPGGDLLASCSSDGTIRIWNPETGEPLRTLNGHDGLVRSVRFSPDGQKLLTASYDGTARLWDIETGNEVGRLAAHAGPVTCATFDLNGDQIVSSSMDNTVAIWDVVNLQRRIQLRGHGEPVWQAEFAVGDRRIISIGDDQRVRLWSAVQIEPTGSLRQGVVEKLAISPDGSRVAVSYEQDPRIHAFARATGTELFQLDMPNVSQWQWNEDGSFFVLQEYPNELLVFDSTGTHSCEMTAAGAFGLSRSLVASSADRQVLVRRLRDGKTVAELAVKGEPHRLEISHDETLLAVLMTEGDTKQQRLHVFNLKNGRQQFERSGILGTLFSEDDQLLAVFDQSPTVTLLNAKTGELVTRVEVGSRVTAATFVPPQIVSSDDVSTSRRLCTATQNGRISIWDVRTGRLVVTLDEVDEPLDAFCYSDGDLIGYTHLGLVRRWNGKPVSFPAKDDSQSAP